jgi:hypothetical protein
LPAPWPSVVPRESAAVTEKSPPSRLRHSVNLTVTVFFSLGVNAAEAGLAFIGPRPVPKIAANLSSEDTMEAFHMAHPKSGPPVGTPIGTADRTEQVGQHH